MKDGSKNSQEEQQPEQIESPEVSRPVENYSSHSDRKQEDIIETQ